MEDLQVIIERLDNIKDQNDKAHQEIKEQVCKTNGSVASLKIWRAYMTGAIAILSAIVVPAAIVIFSKFLDNNL